MPKNKGKGGKNRKRGKNEADDEKRELIFKEDGQEYAQVTNMLGNGRLEANCIDAQLLINPNLHNQQLLIHHGIPILKDIN